MPDNQLFLQRARQDSNPATVSLEGCCDVSNFDRLEGRGWVLDGFTAAKELQDRVAAGEAVDRELLEGFALAVIAQTREGRIALAVRRAVSDEECLSWTLDLSDTVLAGNERAPDDKRPRSDRSGGAC
jgi:hypothetical protein